MDNDIIIKIGSFSRDKRIYDEEYDEKHMHENILKLFAIISLKKEQCTRCENESYGIFGGLCNKCISNDDYELAVLSIDKIMEHGLKYKNCFLFDFDSVCAHNEKLINNYEPIISIKKSILNSIRRNIVSDRVSKITSFFGTHFLFFLRANFNEIILEGIDFIFDIVSIKPIITFKIEPLDKKYPCFIVQINYNYNEKFTIHTKMYILTYNTKCIESEINYINMYGHFNKVKTYAIYSHMANNRMKKISYYAFINTVNSNKINCVEHEYLQFVKTCHNLREDIENYNMLSHWDLKKKIKKIFIPHVYEYGTYCTEYQKIWGKLYFDIFGTNMSDIDSHFELLSILDIFVRKYFTLKSKTCYVCFQNINLSILGRCTNCIIKDTKNIILVDIEHDIAIILKFLHNTTYNRKFVIVVNKIIEEIGMNYDSQHIIRDNFNKSYMSIQCDILKAIVWEYCCFHCEFSGMIHQDCTSNMKYQDCTSNMKYQDCTSNMKYQDCNFNINFTHIKNWNNIFSILFLENTFFKDNNIKILREIKLTVINRFFDFMCIMNENIFLVEIDDESHDNKHNKGNDEYKNNIANIHGLHLFRVNIKNLPSDKSAVTTYIHECIELLCIEIKQLFL